MLLSYVIKLAFLCSSVRALWHAYDPQKKYDQCARNDNPNERHADFKRQTKLIAQEKKDKWRLWPSIVSKQDSLDGETMYGFEEGMDAIWKNQHPDDCSKAKFLIGGGWESGFGSELHVLGTGLALALKMNRVYLLLATNGDSGRMDKMHSINKWQVDIDYCRKQNNTNLDCYFEPWSSCTLDDALAGSSMQGVVASGLSIEYNVLKLQQDHQERTIIAHFDPGVRDDIPPQLAHILHCSPFDRSKYRYWWRSLAIAYMMRPNEPTRQLLLQHRQDKEMAFDKEMEQCVSVHIRRGDKHLEMKLVDDDSLFYDSARELWAGLKNRTETSQERGVMFLGSEDAGVFASADSWAKNNSFDVRYTNLFDRGALSTRLNSTEQAELRAKNAYVHHDMEYFNMLLTLDGHLRCRAFVCTQRSNYCRVIDELRATVGHKANKQYADFTCNPPCIDSPRTDIDWRR